MWIFLSETRGGTAGRRAGWRRDAGDGQRGVPSLGVGNLPSPESLFAFHRWK